MPHASNHFRFILLSSETVSQISDARGPSKFWTNSLREYVGFSADRELVVECCHLDRGLFSSASARSWGADLSVLLHIDALGRRQQRKPASFGNDASIFNYREAEKTEICEEVSTPAELFAAR